MDRALTWSPPYRAISPRPAIQKVFNFHPPKAKIGSIKPIDVHVSGGATLWFMGSIDPSELWSVILHTINGHESASKLQLFSSFISPPSFSVRIALNLKGVDYECKPVYLFKGEQFQPEYLKINPMGYVPAIVDGDIILADSSAIMWYLDEKYPQHPLLPSDFKKKAINYQASHVVSSSLQPILRVPILMYIKEHVGHEQQISWIHKHLEKCFTALEELLKDHAGKYATGDELFLADVFLAPYVIGYPEKYNFDMTEFPLLSRLGEEYLKIEAIQGAIPEKQIDFDRSFYYMDVSN
ncbi:glutathione S-transferase zeta class-like [Rutidosis leptorrhynchoides]|uniref:glutathione S-transferase zeta class-like n=1 Tax=Rutidosis leptorrhynchoides TaxID=125765 RepID=UPI003A99EF44